MAHGFCVTNDKVGLSLEMWLDAYLASELLHGLGDVAEALGIGGGQHRDQEAHVGLHGDADVDVQKLPDVVVPPGRVHLRHLAQRLQGPTER